MIRSGLLALLPVLATAADASDLEDPTRWRKYSFGSLWVVTDASESTTRELGRQLATFRAVLEDTSTYLRFDKVATTHIVAFRDANDLPTPTTRAARDRDWRGFHIGSNYPGFETFILTTTSAAQPVESTRRFKSFQPPSVAVIHEYVHHVLAASFPSLPLWLNEGLATFYSTYWAERGIAEIGRPDADVLAAVRAIEPVPMADFFGLRELGSAGIRSEALYAQSWAIVHYVLRGNPQRGEQFGRFLYLLRQGRAQAEAWMEAFGVPPDTVRDEAYRYVRRGSFAVRRYDLSVLRWAPLGAPQPLVPGELLGMLAKVRLRLEDLDGAEARAVVALAADPAQSRALQALAEIRSRRGAADEAVELGVRALRASRGDRPQELEASVFLDSLGQGKLARQVLDEPVPPQP
ncbi:MAG TPA: hypothetical protein VF139_03960 [Candidatus Polarisedimenticolaceae bacterium]